VNNLQSEANARLSSVEVWCWRDADGSGGSSVSGSAANSGSWTRLWSATGANVVALGWNGQAQGVDGGTPGELLTAPLTLPAAGQNQRYVLLLRVVAATGFSNLMPTNGAGLATAPYAEIWSASGPAAYGLTAYRAPAGVAPGAVRYVKIQPAHPVSPGPVNNP
jgi:hypothetical protein